MHAVGLQTRGRIGEDGGLIELELVMGSGSRARQDAGEVAAVFGIQDDGYGRPIDGAWTSFEDGLNGDRARRPDTGVDRPVGQDFDPDCPPARWGRHGEECQALSTHGVAANSGPLGVSELGIAKSWTK